MTTTTQTTQDSQAPTWRPFSGGEVMALPYLANIHQLSAGCYARNSSQDPVGALVYVEAVSYDSQDAGRVLFRHVNNNTGELGALWVVTSRARMFPDRQGNPKALWALDRSTLDIVF